MKIFTLVHVNLEDRCPEDMVWASSSHLTLEAAQLAVENYLREHEIDWMQKGQETFWGSEDYVDTIRIEETTI